MINDLKEVKTGLKELSLEFDYLQKENKQLKQTLSEALKDLDYWKEKYKNK